MPLSSRIRSHTLLALSLGLLTLGGEALAQQCLNHCLKELSPCSKKCGDDKTCLLECRKTFGTCQARCPPDEMEKIEKEQRKKAAEYNKKSKAKGDDREEDDPEPRRTPRPSGD